MKYEHLVEINDVNNDAIALITREKLWAGLVMRAELPQLFMSYIDECFVSNRTEKSMSRALRFGDLTIVDEVELAPLHYVHYAVPAQNDIPASSLRMTIEEPEPNALFVRFAYDNGNNGISELDSDSEEVEKYNAYRRSAYHEADIDTVRIIRELAEAGRLDALLS